MKRILCILVLLFLLSYPCAAQSIFIDYHIVGKLDQSMFWVLTDSNGVEYRGNCDIALGLDPNAYVQDHMDEWLTEIYDPNKPWANSHEGTYREGLDAIDAIDTWEEYRAFERRKFKGTYPVMGFEGEEQ